MRRGRSAMRTSRRLAGVGGRWRSGRAGCGRVRSLRLVDFWLPSPGSKRSDPAASSGR